MTKLVIGEGPAQGPAGTVSVHCAEANWPVVTGEGNYGERHQLIEPSLMLGDPQAGIPADPRLESWSRDFVAVLRVIDVACQPIDYLPDYFAVTVPDSQTLLVAYMKLDDKDYVARLADAYRAAGYEVVDKP